MPAKHPALYGTLAYFAECGRTVFIVCERCGHCSIPKLHTIAQRVGWRTDAREISAKLRCTACGQRGGKVTTERPRRAPDAPTASSPRTRGPRSLKSS